MSIALIFVVVVAKLFWIKRLETKKYDSFQEVSASAPEEEIDEVESFGLNFSHYALVSAMLSSFLVGVLTFVYSGMVLMLRKEGAYAEQCACGSFWYVLLIPCLFDGDINIF